MKIRIAAAVIAMAMVATGLSASVSAQEDETPTVPEAPQILDPADDANHHSFATETGGASISGADILAIWFTNDADVLDVHIQTTDAQRPESMTFEVLVDPAIGSHCLVLRIQTPGELNEGNAKAATRGDCGDAEGAGAYSEAAGPEGTSILSASFERSLDAVLLADGRELQSPTSTVGWNLHELGEKTLVIDDTDLGATYTIQHVEEEPAPAPSPSPTAGEEEEDPEKEKCKKKKNKKKRKKCEKNKEKDEG